MTIRPAAILAVLLAALSVPGVASASRVARYQSQLQTARLSLSKSADDARRILELRATRKRIAEQKRPEQDVIARVNATLAEAGIPLERFGGLRPESDSALPGDRQGPAAYRRQTVRITLNQLSVPQLGAFLSTWIAAQNLWIPTRIDLSHVRETVDPARYDTTILISATYIAQ